MLNLFAPFQKVCILFEFLLNVYFELLQKKCAGSCQYFWKTLKYQEEMVEILKIIL